jgi:MFS family permease
LEPNARISAVTSTDSAPDVGHDRPPLPPLARRLLFGVVFSAVGGGLTFPFLFVYYTDVRGLPTQTVGLLFAWMGLLSLVCAPIGGTLIDRFGSRPVTLVGTAMEAVGVGCQAFVRDTGDAIILTTFLAIGTMGLYAASTALMTRLVPEELRQRTYGVQFMIMNAGIGIGGLIGSFMIDVSRPVTFERLYFLNAAAYVVSILIVATLPRGSGASPPPEPKQAGEASGWTLVLRDRTMLLFVAIATVVVTCGYQQMETGFAAYSINDADVAPRVLGWAFAANTAAIVVGQLWVLRRIEGRRRTRLLAACSALWSLSWLVVAISPLASPTAAIVLVVSGLGLFGLAETLWAPVSPALVNSLAPEALRGRYNALASMTFTFGMIAGPASAGLLLGADLPLAWVSLTVGGTALGALGFLRLGRRLTAEQDGVGVRDGDPAHAMPPGAVGSPDHVTAGVTST